MSKLWKKCEIYF